jgi:hypothetical protein
VRSLAAAALDEWFDRTSPIPDLPQELAVEFGRWEITLPPVSLALPGNQSVGGLLHIVSVAKTLGATSVFEVGTYNGLTALTLAMNLPEATIHTLDLAAGEIPALPLFSQDYSNLIQFERRAYEGTPFAKNIASHRGDSATFDFSEFEKSAELVYIDGAHSYDYVSNDSAAAFRIVKERGAIVWDDYWRRVPDVARFLHEHKQPGMFRLPGSRLVVWLSESALHLLKANKTRPPATP